MTPEVLTIVATILFLAFLECALSIDNAIVLAIMVRHLPPAQRKRALTYGMAGAFAFRIGGLFALQYIFAFGWLKAVAAAYLIYLAVKHFFFSAKEKEEVATVASNKSFWATIVAIELTDIAFAVDSLFAAAALSKEIWVVALGGILGIIAMRFAATGAGKILDKMPSLESTAYQLVALIGVKLLLESFSIPGVDFHDTHSYPFWTFWALMVLILVVGLVLGRRQAAKAKAPGGISK